MPILQVGRVGLDVELSYPADWNSSGGGDRRVEHLDGQLAAASLAETQALRTELLAQCGQVCPITFSVDPTMDGFYVLEDAQIYVDEYGLNDSGLFDFRISARRIGGLSQIEIQSLLTGVVLANVHGLEADEVEFWHSPAVGALALDHGDTAPTAHTRTTEDGTIPVILAMAIDDDPLSPSFGTPVADPAWSVAPADYYKGGCALTVDGRVRAGLDVPHDVPDWILSNGLVRVTPGVTTGVSNGRVELAAWSTAWDTPKSFALYSAGVNVIPEWHYMTVLHYTPEKAVIRLVRDAEEAPATTHRHVLDIHMRRGAPWVGCHYSWTGPSHDLKVAVNTPEAGTAVTPTGASSSPGIRASANDAAGNRYVIATPLDHTQDTGNGAITFDAITECWWMLGLEIGGSGAGTHNLAADLILQYFGWAEEQQRVVRR